MWVRAIAEGYYGKLRTPGAHDDTFEVPDGAKASWWVKVDAPKGKAGRPGDGSTAAHKATSQAENSKAKVNPSKASDSSTDPSKSAGKPAGASQ